MVLCVVKSEEEIGMEKATSIVIRYFEKIHGSLGLLSFRLENVNPNSKENVWIVECNFLPSLGSDKRVFYTVKVDINTGKLISARERKINDD